MQYCGGNWNAGSGLMLKPGCPPLVSGRPDPSLLDSEFRVSVQIFWLRGMVPELAYHDKPLELSAQRALPPAPRVKLARRRNFEFFEGYNFSLRPEKLTRAGKPVPRQMTSSAPTRQFRSAGRAAPHGPHITQQLSSYITIYSVIYDSG